MYPETLRRATCRRLVSVTQMSASGLLELRIALDEFLCAAAGEAYRNAAVFIVTFDPHDCSNTETGMSDPSAEHGVCVTSAFRGGASKRA